jgi:transcriptional regulator with XRE-family HTH domain
MRDIALRLKLVREERGLSQKDAARLSKVGEKTISSFETGQRIHTIKLSQLTALCEVYGLTVVAFLAFDEESLIAEPAMAPVHVAALEQPTAFVRRREPSDPLRHVRRGDDDAHIHLGSSLGASHAVHTR